MYQLSCLISHIKKVWKPKVISLKYLSASLYIWIGKLKLNIIISPCGQHDQLKYNFLATNKLVI